LKFATPPVNVGYRTTGAEIFLISHGSSTSFCTSVFLRRGEGRLQARRVHAVLHCETEDSSSSQIPITGRFGPPPLRLSDRCFRERCPAGVPHCISQARNSRAGDISRELAFVFSQGERRPTRREGFVVMNCWLTRLLTT